MFNSKKRAMSKANKVLTATGLLKAAFAHDNDAMMEIVTGQTADDEGIWFALETFIGVAHHHPSVQDRLAELQYKCLMMPSPHSFQRSPLPRLIIRDSFEAAT